MPKYRGASGRWLHQLANLSLSEAKHFLLHDPLGRVLLRDTGADIGELAGHLVAASNKQSNKSKEASKMDSTQRMLKNVRSMGEHEYTRIVSYYAKQQYPELTRPQAFTKLFTEDSDEGRAIRKFWQISKGAVLADSAGREYGVSGSRGYTSGALDDDEAADEGKRVEDDALEQLNELAQQARRRDPKLTKAQAFTKVYVDPSNAALAAKERLQNRPR